MAQAVHGSIKQIAIELEDGKVFIIPNADIEHAEVTISQDHEDLMTVDEPVVRTIYSNPMVRMILVLLSDEITIHYYIPPEELPSGPKLLVEESES